MSRYGNTRAARAMDDQDREKDLMRILMVYLSENPIQDPFLQADTLMMLKNLERRSR